MIATVDDRAFGTSVRLVVTRGGRLAAAKVALDSVLQAVDQACSRFREDSELSGLNSRPGEETTLSPILTRALAAALRGARLTGGALDPTVGGAIRAIGYDGDFEAIRAPTAAIALPSMPVPGWERLWLDERRRIVWLPRGVEIDLGATAKAMAADIAADAALKKAGAGGVLVSLGGDVAVAGDPPPGGWHIHIEEDSGGAPSGEDAEAITIHTGAVATSSTTVRTWRRGGVVLHHIIDPRTGRSAEGEWRTVSVVAGTCVDANIASTAAIVMGRPAMPWLEAAGLPARLVARGGSISRIAGWPSPQPSAAAS
jgi:thiamine biosynthesis lipoprotein